MESSGTTAGERRLRFVVISGLILALLSAMTGAVWLAARPAEDDAAADPRGGHARGARVRSDAATADAGADGIRTAHAPRRTRGEDVPVPPEEANAKIRLPGTDPATAADARTAEDGGAANGADAADPSGIRAVSGSRSNTRSGGASGRKDLQGSVNVHVTAAESGEPVRDAQVVFTLRDAPPRDLRTDGNGRAVFFAPVGTSGAVDVKARGRFRERRDPLVVSSAETAVEIALTRGVVVRGTVTGPAGPVRGARIRAVDHAALLASLPYGAEPRALETATTDRSGAYWLDCLPRGVACILIAEADGLAPKHSPLEAQPDVDYVAREDVAMKAAWTLEGAVKDVGGRAVADAWVYAFDTDEIDLDAPDRPFPKADAEELTMLDVLRVATRGEWPIPPRTRSDASGRFRLVVRESLDSVRTIAMHATQGRSIPSAGAGPRTASVDLVLRGRVRAEFEWLTASGKAAGGLTTGPYFPWDRWSVSPKSPGRYGVADMEEGPMACVVSGAAGAPGVYVGRRVDEKRLLWRGQLQAPVVWRGAVVDDRKLPVVGARVTAGPVSAFSGEHGAFVIEGVHPRHWELTAIADGHPEVDVTVDTGPQDGIVVTLPRDAPLRLRLNLPAGATAPTWHRVWTLSSKERSWWSQDSGWTDRFAWNDGEIAIADVESHDDLIAVFVPGYAVVVRTIRAAPGETTELAAIQLEAPRRAAGTVVDESGQVVPYASVCIRTTGNALWLPFLPERWVDCDGTGSFVVDAVAPEQPCEIVAAATGFATTPQPVAVKAGVLQTVVIGRGFEIRGRWLTHDGKPTVVRLLGPGETVYATVPLARDGTFEATVPRRPRAVAVLLPGQDIFPERTIDVPATFPDGDVLLIP